MLYQEEYGFMVVFHRRVGNVDKLCTAHLLNLCSVVWSSLHVDSMILILPFPP